MFQSFKRAKYISQSNFHHHNTQDGVRMHLWLQKNGWPANEFVDWFMRAYPIADDYNRLSFKLYLTDQFDWVYEKNSAAIGKLYERILSERFQAQDKDGMTSWLKNIYDSANSS